MMHPPQITKIFIVTFIVYYSPENPSTFFFSALILVEGRADRYVDYSASTQAE